MGVLKSAQAPSISSRWERLMVALLLVVLALAVVLPGGGADGQAIKAAPSSGKCVTGAPAADDVVPEKAAVSRSLSAIDSRIWGSDSLAAGSIWNRTVAVALARMNRAQSPSAGRAPRRRLTK